MGNPMGSPPQQTQGIGALQNAYASFMNQHPPQPNPMFGQQPSPMQSSGMNPMQQGQPMGGGIQQTPMQSNPMPQGQPMGGGMQQNPMQSNPMAQQQYQQFMQAQQNPMQQQSAAYDQFKQAQQAQQNQTLALNNQLQAAGKPGMLGYSPDQMQQQLQSNPMQGNMPMGGGMQAQQAMQQAMQAQQNPMQSNLMQQMGKPMGGMPQAPTTQQMGREDPRMQAMRRMQQMNFGNK
jgi:hypothetical protein